MNGYGFYHWHDGRKYYGEWQLSQMHGYGIYKYRDGVIYYG